MLRINIYKVRFRKIFGIISGIYTWQSRALTVYKSLLRAIPERFVTVSQLRIRRISAWRMYVSYSPWEEHCYYRLELLTISLLQLVEEVSQFFCSGFECSLQRREVFSTEPMLATHFGGRMVNPSFAKYAKHVAQHLALHDHQEVNY